MRIWSSKKKRRSLLPGGQELKQSYGERRTKINKIISFILMVLVMCLVFAVGGAVSKRLRMVPIEAKIACEPPELADQAAEAVRERFRSLGKALGFRKWNVVVVDNGLRLELMAYPESRPQLNALITPWLASYHVELTETTPACAAVAASASTEASASAEATADESARRRPASEPVSADPGEEVAPDETTETIVLEERKRFWSTAKVGSIEKSVVKHTLVKEPELVLSEGFDDVHFYTEGFMKSPVIELTFHARDAAAFKEVFERNEGRTLALVLDDLVVASARVVGDFPGSKLRLLSMRDRGGTRRLARRLKCGPLPCALKIVNVRVGKKQP